MHATTLALGAVHESAATELTAGSTAINAAVGLLILLAGWSAHHKLAHVHRHLDLVARVLIVAGATLLLAGPGASLLVTINGWTATWIAHFASFAHISNNWPQWAGALTLIEVPLLIWTAAHVITHFKRRGSRSGPADRIPGVGGGQAKGHILGNQWGRLEHYFDRYGLILVGPNTATLPGLIGFWAAWPFAALAAAIGGFVGHLV